MGQTIEATFTPTKPETIMNLVGINDANLRLIEESYDVQVTDTGSEIEVTGEESIVKKIMQIFTALDKVVTRGVTITATDVVSAIKMADKGTLEFFGELYNKILIRDAKGRPVRVKNMGQKRYIEAIQKAKEGAYDEAERLMNEGDEFFSEAHGVHGNLLAQEASGDKVEFSLILMHAEDQMASTEMAKVLAREIIELYQKR